MHDKSVAKRRWFFVWLLPLLWSVTSFLAAFFPGDEYGLWGSGSFAGIWGIAVCGNSGSVWRLVPYVLGAGVLTVAVFGFLLDLLRARRLIWLGVHILVAGAVCVISVGAYPSYAKAISKNGSLLAYILFSSNFGLYISIVVMLIVAGACRIFRRRRPGPGDCQSCGYNLTGNVSGRCPECGTPTG